LWSEEIHKGLVQILLTFNIKRNVVKVFLFVFVERFAFMFLRKESQLLGITSSKNGVVYGLSFTRLNVIEQ
jgi:hypothetical protein